MKKYNRFNILLLSLVATVIISSCSKDSDNNEQPVHSWYVSAEQKGGLTQQAMQTMATLGGFSAFVPMVNYDVQLRKVTYHTEYPAGTPVLASGMLVMPATVSDKLPIVVYMHGTVATGGEPSASITHAETLLCAIMASSFGCVVLLPDYIGYGASDDIVHPYIHKESLGQAGLDFIRAYQEYAAEEGAPFTNRVMLTGYSEGGYAAVALQKKIQETPAAGLKIEKAIAGSGPYDNVNFGKTFLATDAACDAHFISSYLWGIQMYKDCYGYAKSYADIFSAVDNAKLQARNYDMAYFRPDEYELSTNPAQLFQQSFRLDVAADADTDFLRVLGENSLTDFAPQDSLILVYGSADTWVYPLNSINAYDAMHDKGCKVALVSIEGGDHSSTMLPYCNVVLNRLQLFE
ncbi:MAG: alpha/beta fold hydrolase [Prevotellaceae bacterium]|jgi:poly(3-hydroxybutyrate) depolymerase|nr:alpha/beta fold hydrolase [Prevotellaceae bacterium]